MNLLFFGIGLLLYFCLHSLLAHEKAKDFLIKKFFGKKYYRLFFNAVSVLTLLPLFLFYRKIETSFLFENDWSSFVGIGMMVIGAVLFVIALKQYNLSEFAGTQQLKTKIPPVTETLQTSGLNAIVRHPLYFSGLLLLWGYFLFRPTDLFLVVTLVSTFYLYFGTKLEEEKLEKEFGTAYLKYKKEVPMLIPFLKF